MVYDVFCGCTVVVMHYAALGVGTVGTSAKGAGFLHPFVSSFCWSATRNIIF